MEVVDTSKDLNVIHGSLAVLELFQVIQFFAS